MPKKQRRDTRTTPVVNAAASLSTETRKAVGMSLALAAITLMVYSRVLFNDFIRVYDDELYVLGNDAVKAGLTLPSLYYALTAECVANWHPLTMLSHILDCQVYGLHAWGHHLTSLAFHTANTILLFLVLRRMTGSLWRSAFVAALFAVHPLHVQSVAHVAQRKDVLSAFFWLLTMLAYARYTATQGKRPYALTLLFFALGLLAKPILVSLPLVLLLMDYWPLKRFSIRGGLAGTVRAAWPMVREKIPLFALTLLFSAITFLVQFKSETVAALAYRPLTLRIENALISYVTYLRKMVWPDDLAAHYPYPDDYSGWLTASAAALLAAITAVVLWQHRKRPYCAVGWFWYVIALAPMIGIVQVGAQALADRYTYVTLIGVYIILAWGGHDFLARWKSGRVVAAGLAAVILPALMVCTWFQLGYWNNAETLWRRALAVTVDNSTAHQNLGLVLLTRESQNPQGAHLKEALEHAFEAVRIQPMKEELVSLGIILGQAGRLAEAEECYRKALALAPSYDFVHHELGVLYAVQNRLEEAEACFQKVEPKNPDREVVVGNIFFEQGSLDRAAAHYHAALQLDAKSASAYYNLGRLYEHQGKWQEALEAYERAHQLKPNLDVTTHTKRVRAKQASSVGKE